MTSSESQSVTNKCDYYDKSRHSKFRCIHKKKHKGINVVGPEKTWIPKSHIVLIVDIIGRKKPRFKLIPRQGLLTTHDGEKFMFLDLKALKGGAFAFGGMCKGKITSISKIGIPSIASINNVLYVEGLKYNLLNIS